MKKIMLGVCLMLMAFFARSQGLEGVIVEKYYVSNADDAAGSEGILPVGSITYRIYLDLKPGYKFQALYGSPSTPTTGYHELKLTTTTTFFNNEDRGATTPNGISVTNTRKNTVALDSWFSVGATATGKVGVLKTEDTDGALANSDGILQNEDPSAGIPIKTQDGMISGTPESVTFVGLSAELDVFDATSQAGNSFFTADGSIAALNGAKGPTAENRVLIGQFTTDGKFCYELNIQIGTPDGNTENYVAKNPVGNEILFPSLAGGGCLAVNLPPTVNITGPADGTNFNTGDLVNISAAAVDSDGTISNVEFFVDGNSIGQDTTAPYMLNWTSILGPHKLTAVATDDKSATDTSQVVNIHVMDPIKNKLPVVEITSPLNGSNVTTGKVVTIQATASDSDGTITNVEFLVDGTTIGNDPTAPYSFDWASLVGTHMLTAIATDDDGALDTSNVITIVVKDSVLPNKAPVVNITTPANSATFTTGNTVNIQASASDVNGTVTNVAFLVDGNAVGNDAIAPYSFNWTSVAGTHNLTAIATDDDGAMDTSNTVTIVVKDSVLLNKVPVVNITAPANGATFTTGNTVNIQASASDVDGTVTNVVFLVDGNAVGNDATAPYSFNWTSVAGTHNLTAIATDDDGAMDTSNVVTIVVKDSVLPNKSPVVNFTAPANGATFTTGNTVNIQASASDVDGTVTNVAFLVDGNTVGNDATAPYSFNWTSAAGTHNLTAIATDDDGAMDTSNTVTIVVKDSVLPNKAPVVNITAPANGATFTTGNTVNIQASASDVDGTVTNVVFLVDGNAVGNDATAPYSFNWTSVAGTHNLTAIATDDDGAMDTSNVVTIVVKDSVLPNKAPVVNITAPANGATFTTGNTVNIQASASDVDGTVTNVAFLVDGNAVGNDATAPYSFNWTSVAGTHNLTAIATDDDGAMDTSNTVTIVVKDSITGNNTPPVIIITTPVTGSILTTGDIVSIKANASDLDGFITLVEFYVNGSKIGQDATAPYATNWTSINGTFTLTAVATDDDGAKANSQQVIIKVRDNPCASSSFKVNLGPDKTVKIGYTPEECVELVANTTSKAYGYSWNTGATTSSITVCPKTATSYTVIAINSRGCTASDVVLVCAKDVRCNNNSYVNVCWTYRRGGQIVSRRTYCLPAPIAHILVTYLNSNNSQWSIGSCSDSSECGPGKTLASDGEDVGSEEHLTAREYALIYGEKPTIKIYPNPASTIAPVNLEIHNISDASAKVSVMNIVGQVIYSEQLNVDKHSITKQIDFGYELPRGTYLITITTDKNVVTEKLIIQ